MRMRSLLMVTLALACGTSAAVVAGKWANARGDQSEETTTVVVAAADLPRFATVTAEAVKTKAYPKTEVPTGAMTRLDEVIGRVTDIPILKDEPVLERKLSDKGAGRGMAAVIPKGMRAVTIHTPTLATGLAGFLLPGNRVDVLFTVRTSQPNDGTGGGSTTTLLHSVEVLAVNQRIEAPAENKIDQKEVKTVTLLVTPTQAAQVELAQENGTLHLALRNPLDTEAASAGAVTLDGIRFKEGRPLDERLAALMDKARQIVTSFQEAALAAAKEKEARDRAAKEKEARERAARANQPEAPPTPLTIRTSRGGQTGQVTVDAPR